MTLAEIQARPTTAAERAQIAALDDLPDSQIDFSDQEEITPEKIAAGHYVVTRRGGARRGAGRPALGKQRKLVTLSPQTIRRIEAYARRKKLPHFSAAIEALAAKS